MVLLLVLPGMVKAQAIKIDSIPAVNSKDSSADVIEKEAEFPGGTEKWQNFIAKNLNPKVPVKNGAPRGTYRVIISFIIEKDGSIVEAIAVTDPGYGMAEEAIRVIKKSPKWKPAVQNGTYLMSKKSQPFIFQID